MLPEQCKAARNWLGWSMDELAAKANVGSSTIRDFEAGRRVPHRNRLATIRQALEVAGMVLTGEGSERPGIAGPRVVVVKEKEEEPKKKPPGRKRSSGTKRKA
jgi:ribosome-binding protein aMBF1 (putative translation factor)